MSNSYSRIKGACHCSSSGLNRIENGLDRTITNAVYHEIKLFLMKR